MQSATNLVILGTLFLFSLFAIGCGSMCVSTPDCEFHAYGGLRDRQDRVNGRVASLIDPALALPGSVPTEEPLPPLERDEADDETSDDESGDGLGEETEEDKAWREKLLDQLDDMKLPTDDIPELGGKPGAESSKSSEGFDEI